MGLIPQPSSHTDKASRPIESWPRSRVMSRTILISTAHYPRLESLSVTWHSRSRSLFTLPLLPSPYEYRCPCASQPASQLTYLILLRENLSCILLQGSILSSLAYLVPYAPHHNNLNHACAPYCHVPLLPRPRIVIPCSTYALGSALTQIICSANLYFTHDRGLCLTF